MFVNTKVLVTVLLVAISSTFVHANAIEWPECPSICPALYAPVCGTNGESFTEFGNPCMLQASNCRRERNWINIFEQTDMAWCKTKPMENMNAIVGNLDLNKSECMRPCTMIYAPLCIANDKYRTTISSKCVLDMYNCVLGLTGSRNLFSILKEGSC